ncbi:unnamed protein product [Acanthoscelides obtectus]|uniref:Uncharacterized protein n=1 Tax=Acanthoscelides obtectus TaxID=200917 RepID=A0A9P0Q2Y0_ACAOB|nr:unnamed protein product [Acanthoscelides obtectus]CAK1620548.1 hypothetical protein AOBTE_LOCUS443 [Acanthoscelides obtectus]
MNCLKLAWECKLSSSSSILPFMEYSTLLRRKGIFLKDSCGSLA